MDKSWIKLCKKLISDYINNIDYILSAEKISANDYFKKYGINQQAKAKTSCLNAYDEQKIGFVLKRAYELGYFINPTDEILDQIDKDFDNFTPEHYNYPIANSSAELD